MSSAILEEYGVRRTINTKRFATNKGGVRKGRPTEKWVLVVGVKRVAVYHADKGGIIIEGDEMKAYNKAQTVGKRAGMNLRAVPFSSAFYAL